MKEHYREFGLSYLVLGILLTLLILCLSLVISFLCYLDVSLRVYFFENFGVLNIEVHNNRYHHIPSLIVVTVNGAASRIE